MKRLLLILIITLNFQSWTKAEDIMDFEIEGMSIGDSALDFMSIDEIKETIKLTANNYSYLKNPKIYREAYIFTSNNFKNFEKVSLMFKHNDKNYKILFLRGLIDYNENLIECLSKMNEIANDIENIIPNNVKEIFEAKSPLDKSGNSIYHFIVYKLASGDRIKLSCNDWEEKLREKNNWSEGLSVSLQSKEIYLWLGNHK
mgnify:FL=1